MDESASDLVRRRIDEDNKINIKLHYPFNDKFEYVTRLERIDLDKERENDLRSGRGFIIDEFNSIKKDIKAQGGIFSIRYGSTLYDSDSFIDRYRCNCGKYRGSINHGIRCESCDSLCRYTDDDMGIFGWFVLKDDYFIIHPNLYRSLEAFIGATRLTNILRANIEVDVNGVNKISESYSDKTKKNEPFKGIGIMEFRNRFDEIMKFYLLKYPNKRRYYDDIMNNKNILFCKSIPVFTLLLRPINVDDEGRLKYEGTNDMYRLINHEVNRLNNATLGIQKKAKHTLDLLCNIQEYFNNIYLELKEILAKKKGDIRAATGGRYNFTERSVIVQGVDLKPYQIRLPYHGLVELLQQLIINILERTYNFGYAEAYKRWYKAQLKFDQIIYDIIDGLIKDSDGGLPVLINRNPRYCGRYNRKIVMHKLA